MPGLTEVYAFKDKKEAREKAERLLDAKYAVAIAGPTAIVRLVDDERKQSFWSLEDQADVLVLIASQDGIEPLKLGS